MQVEQDREIEQSRQIEVEDSDAYSLFVYAVRSQITRDYYLRRLRIFFNHISLLPRGMMKERCNLFSIFYIMKSNVSSKEICKGVIMNFIFSNNRIMGSCVWI